MKQAVPLIVACLLVSGCVRHYTLPENVPKAVINLRTNLNGVRVQVYADDKCTHSPHGNRLAYFFLNVADPHSGVDKQIPTNEEFIFTHAFSSTYSVAAAGAIYSGGGTCNVTVGFKPTSGTRYQSMFTRQGDRCVLDLLKVVKGESGEQLVREESARRIHPPCVNNWTD